MKNRIIIFGAGDVGKLAYYYYAGRCEIVCYVDNNSSLWGQTQFDIPIYAPYYLENVEDAKVVIAVRRNRQAIQKQLLERFGISRSISFDISEKVEEMCGDDRIPEDGVIIEYEGGLGNQMFQYAFGRCFGKKGIKVMADTSAYYIVGRREFILDKVFKNVVILQGDIALKKRYEKQNLKITEESIYGLKEKKADLKMLNLSEGYFVGYWQSSQFPIIVEQELRKEFCFNKEKEEKLIQISHEVKNKRSVSVHIRRGDYLERKAQKMMGEICTMQYYQKAMNFMRERFSNAVFYIFCEDIEWCRDNFKDKDIVFMDRLMFDTYEDWYDMYLMSCCKHNIIANSTFSWWGAWLNSNKGKIVIAPKKWLNVCEITDIYPEKWIKL